MELFRLKQLKLSSQTINQALPSPALNHIPEHHIYVSFKHPHRSWLRQVPRVECTRFLPGHGSYKHASLSWELFPPFSKPSCWRCAGRTTVCGYPHWYLQSLNSHLCALRQAHTGSESLLAVPALWGRKKTECPHLSILLLGCRQHSCKHLCTLVNSSTTACCSTVHVLGNPAKCLARLFCGSELHMIITDQLFTFPSFVRYNQRKYTALR